jgi:hypothetical protein
LGKKVNIKMEKQSRARRTGWELCRAKWEELGHDTLHEVLALKGLLFRLELNVQLEEGLVKGLPLLRAAQTRRENEADGPQHETAEASVQPLARRR